MDVDVRGLNSELVSLLGRLRYRYSYGENVLQHSVEVAYLAALMAAEIGADVRIAKEGGLLHDIGKALTHEVEGPTPRSARTSPPRTRCDGTSARRSASTTTTSTPA